MVDVNSVHGQPWQMRLLANLAELVTKELLLPELGRVCRGVGRRPALPSQPRPPMARLAARVGSDFGI